VILAFGRGRGYFEGFGYLLVRIVFYDVQVEYFPATSRQVFYLLVYLFEADALQPVFSIGMWIVHVLFFHWLPPDPLFYVAYAFMDNDAAKPGFEQVLFSELVQAVERGNERLL
jgi:hypothetical protein